MNIIVQATLASGHTIQPLRAVYYSETDHTVLWTRVGNEDRILMDHPGRPIEHPHGGRNRFVPADGAVQATLAPTRDGAPPPATDVVEYAEGPCGCNHVYKRYTPRDPLTARNAHVEHSRP